MRPTARWFSLCPLVAMSAALLFTPPALAKAKVPKGPEIKLLEAGTGDKAPLRYALAKGARSAWTVKVTSESTLSGRALPTQTVVFELNLKVLRVDRKGTARCSVSVKSARLSPAKGLPAKTLEAINKKLDALKAVKGSATVDDRGRLLNYTRTGDKVPAALAPMLLLLDQQVAQAATPLPDAPVGDGASWKVVNHIRSNEIMLVQRARYTLVSRDLKRGIHTLRVAIEQSAAPQRVTLPGMPATLKTRLLSADGQGTSKLTVATDRLGTTGRSSVALKVAIEMTMGSNTAKAALSVNSVVSLAVAGPAPTKKR